MDPALNLIIGPWAQLGIVGSVVLALGAVNIVQWRRHETLQRTIDALHEARLQDSSRCTERYIDMLAKKLETDNRMADGMEAFERIVDKVRQT
jgi:hypothetical protein